MRVDNKRFLPMVFLMNSFLCCVLLVGASFSLTYPGLSGYGSTYATINRHVDNYTPNVRRQFFL